MRLLPHLPNTEYWSLEKYPSAVLANIFDITYAIRIEFQMWYAPTNETFTARSADENVLSPWAYVCGADLWLNKYSITKYGVRIVWIQFIAHNNKRHTHSFHLIYYCKKIARVRKSSFQPIIVMEIEWDKIMCRMLLNCSHHLYSPHTIIEAIKLIRNTKKANESSQQWHTCCCRWCWFLSKLMRCWACVRIDESHSGS